MELQQNGQQGRDSVLVLSAVELRKEQEQSAEGASLGQAKPGETLRQKDPAPNHSGKFLCVRSNLAKDTDGVKF
jgi:hypothetical protein